MNKKAVFLDRDGTLIVDKIYLNDPNQIEYLPGSFESLRLLRDAGFQFIVVTNQSGIARGIVEIQRMDEIHSRMTEEFAKHGVHFSGFYHAPHSVESNHPTRKPNPGMLQFGTTDHRVDLQHSWMIGDRMTDVEAGRRMNLKTILLEGVETADTVRKSGFAAPTAFLPGMLEAAHFILSNNN